MAAFRLLHYQPGIGTWQEALLGEATFSVGQAPGNQLVLNDAQVSPQHAYLHADDQGVRIYDQNSVTGVHLGGRRLPAGQWVAVPLNQNFTIGTTTLRVEAVAATGRQAGPAQPAGHRPPRRARPVLPWVGLLAGAGCLCLAGGAVALALFLPGRLPTSLAGLNPFGPATPGQPAVVDLGPPIVMDSLPASPGGGPITDEHGVSLDVPAEALEAGQSAYLERARLSDAMQQALETAYQVESLAYSVLLQDGQDAIGRAELVLPAPSSGARLAVLVDDRWLGLLELPAQDGVFRVSPVMSLGPQVQNYEPQGGGAATAPNRYLVVTPKAGTAARPESAPGGALFAQAETYGRSCVDEELTANSCWRNTEGSVYVFWGPDFPASLNGQVNDRVIDTIKAVAALMAAYQAKGFTAAAISAARPAYVVVEASAAEPYYSQKTGNVYVPWDVIGAVGDTANRCNLNHEFFHWIEDEEYIMGAAAVSGPGTWWLENSAENGAFLLEPRCLENNLSKYGIVNTNANVLGFQAAPAEWDWSDQARYVHAHQLYLSICEGGANCALSEADWVKAINAGTYPLIGDKLSTYKRNARDLGLYLLGAAPQDSRAGATIPPAAVSGNRFGDYLILQTGTRGPWDFGLTMNQFTQVSPQLVKAEAKIASGGVYPLWVSNGTRTPMSANVVGTGLPGLLEIVAGPAFWLKQDQAAPVFYPAGTGLKVGPISNRLGIGTARIVAIAPDTDQTFQATLSLADLSGDWSVTTLTAQYTAVDCGSSDPASEQPQFDSLLQYFSAYGTYVKDPADPNGVNLIWQGTLPDDVTGASEVTVTVDRVTLHYRITVPKPAIGGVVMPGLTLGRRAAATPAAVPSGAVTLWAALPGVGLVLWWPRRPRWSKRAQAGLVLLAALLLTGCIGVHVWGTLDGTYTFDKLEYVPAEAPAAGAPTVAPTVNWRLANGQVQHNVDLVIATESTDADGKTTLVDEDPCRMTATGTVSGTIGPEGSVLPPPPNE